MHTKFLNHCAIAPSYGRMYIMNCHYIGIIRKMTHLIGRVSNFYSEDNLSMNVWIESGPTWKIWAWKDLGQKGTNYNWGKGSVFVWWILAGYG